MHLQGRRWGATGVEKENAFESGSDLQILRRGTGGPRRLLAELQDLHKSLLSSMQFVVELNGMMDEHNPEVDRIIAVHAGLEWNVPLNEQLLSCGAGPLTEPGWSLSRDELTCWKPLQSWRVTFLS